MGIMKSPAKVLLSFILLASGLTALPNQLQPRVRSARSKQVTVVAPQNTPASRSTLDPTTSALTSSTTGKIKSIPLPTTDHPDDTLADNRIGVAEEAVAASTNVPKKINNDADRAEIDAGNDDGREDERIEQKNSPIGNAEGPAATAFPPAPRESLGKIRPQLKLTTNYTSASEVSGDDDDEKNDGRQAAGRSQRGSGQAYEVPLLPPQPAHLPTAGMCCTTGMQRGLREAEFHPATVRLSGTLQGPVQRVVGQRRPTHYRTGHRPPHQGPDIGKDVRAGGGYEGMQGAEGLVSPCAAERQNREIPLSGDMSVPRH
ncbi:uncharacterized protein LOC105693432 isoform X2 [Athalia rosae]|uniref:uncharacterized protein LOC105693432 isoform X2 n=1 Tax=Athalia rosae TaxID=37344 RepID=UPI0020336CAA|nr:uncharacterized protein LOC105693432 isoform X2 [Athalia rosae]